MKLHILSDLHLSRGVLPHPRPEADLVILAGDIARPTEALAWAAGFDKPVLYVAGNHEFYGGSIDGTMRELKARAAGTRIRVLDDEEVVIDGVRFLGSTLWTDYLLFGAGEARTSAMALAAQFMRDFSRIRMKEDSPALFTPADAAALFRRHAAWLADRLAEPHAGPTVVVTHHAPSPKSIHPRFAGSPINASFVSDLEPLMPGGGPELWIHGHTHDSFDYRVNSTRVLCNPRGYARDGINENALFDPLLTVEVGGAAALNPSPARAGS
jgi:predicted phosphodiesterase